MFIQIKRHTIEEFEEFIDLPENADKLFEFIGGEIVEVPSNPYSSFIGSIILTAVMTFVMQHKLGYVTGEAGGYMVSGERYAPDVAFISKEHQPKLAQEGYNPNPPDLAVEVVSPTDSPRELQIKISNYVAAGTTVWIARSKEREMEVHAPGQPVKILGIDDILDGGDVLPGFKLAVKDVFPTDDE